MLLQPADDDDGNHAFNTAHFDGHTTAVNSILTRLVWPQAKLGSKGHLVALKLAAHQPAADSEAQHGRTLASHPHGIVGRDAGPRSALVHYAAVGEADGDESRTRRGKREQSRMQQVAQLPGILGGE